METTLHLDVLIKKNEGSTWTEDDVTELMEAITSLMESKDCYMYGKAVPVSDEEVLEHIDD